MKNSKRNLSNQLQEAYFNPKSELCRQHTNSTHFKKIEEDSCKTLHEGHPT